MADRFYDWTCRCGAEQAMTRDTRAVYLQSHATFYCIHGHQSHYPEGPSEEDKVRRERDRLAQQIAHRDDEIKMWRATADDQRAQAVRERNRANGYKGHATRITKRVKAGVCPCCNRTFKQLAAHMANKHPTFTPIDIPIGEPATIQ